ncbi:unnamed protein product, partial [Chrysoparadoxa australica]
GRAKHIDVHYHWIRDRTVKGHIKVTHIATNDQLADTFAKGWTKTTFCKMAETIMGHSTQS